METTKLRDVSSSRGGWRTVVEKPFMGRKPNFAKRYRGNRIFRLWLYQYGYAREDVTCEILCIFVRTLSRPYTRGCHHPHSTCSFITSESSSAIPLRRKGFPSARTACSKSIVHLPFVSIMEYQSSVPPCSKETP